MKIKSLCMLLILVALFSISLIAVNRSMAMEHIKSNQIQEDGAILAWLIVLNKTEIAAANVASDRELKPGMKSYFQKIKKDHMRNLQETLRISHQINENPIKTDVAVRVQQASKKQIQELKTLDDEAFQQHYLEFTLETHRAAVNKINHDYLKSVHSATLKEHLKTTRQQIENHLEKAKRMQEALQTVETPA